MKQILLTIFFYTLTASILLFVMVILDRTIPGISKFVLLLIAAAAIGDNVRREIR